MPRPIGYARVSTEDQTTDAQATALTAAGCEEIVIEQASGAKRARPELEALLARLGPGDTLMVVRIDRLARSLKHLLDILERVERVGAHFRSLSDPIDTASPQGRLQLSILGAVAEFERALIRERTRAGLATARAKGKRLGNPQLTAGGAGHQIMALKRNAVHVERALAEMPTLLPLLRKYRPQLSWAQICRELAARGITRASGKPWTQDGLLRTLRCLAREGLISEEEATRLLRPAPRRARSAVVARDQRIQTVAGIFNALDPADRSIARIIEGLEAVKLQSATGAPWPRSTVASLLKEAEARGLLIAERPGRGRRTGRM